LVEVEQAIVELETSIKKMEAQEKELKAGLLELMQENNVKKWTGERITLIRKDGGTRITLDSKKVQNEYPDVYCDCIKEVKISESLMVKIN
jgi:predicted phage-related endonuclease